ncbi:MAG: extracellular solute-binding protein [Anaerolineales bacterium]|nr:extracellular solute-binding protein [Anaerolineales bacterium]
MIKKIISLAFLTALVLSACASPEATLTPESAPALQATKTPQPEPTAQAVSTIQVREAALKGVEIKIWMPWYGVEADLFKTLVKEFNQKNKWGITASAESQVNFTNLYDETLAAIQRPDLAIALPEHALEWNENRLVTDLEPYVFDPIYGIEDVDDIPFVFWNQDQLGETRVAMPAQRTARFLLWNKTWGGELGFGAAPDAPEDFQQQTCRAHEALTKNESPQDDFMGGWYVDTQPMTAYAWLLAFEGGVLESGGYRFLTPNNIAAFTFLRKLSEANCAWQSAEIDAITAFTTRRALFITASLQDLPTVARGFAAQDSRDEWQVIPFPGADEDALVVYGSSYVIFNSTPEKQLASWLFVRWMLDDERDARMVEATHLFPLRASTLGLLGDYEQTHPQWKQVLDLLPEGELQPQLASWRKVKIMLGDGFDHMYRVNVFSGQVAAILAQMETLSRDISQ